MAFKCPPHTTPASYPMRRPEVQRVTGLSTSHIYRLMAKGKFPKPTRISHRVVTWQSSEVFAWIQARRAAILGDAA